MRLFGGAEGRSSSAEQARARVTRPSSGWAHMLPGLGARDEQRALDIGPTSSTNINLLTQFGHSIYAANLIGELQEDRWVVTDPEVPIPAHEFVDETLAFHGRTIDTVLFWDAADYLPTNVLEEAVARIHEAMRPGGQLLAFFHSKPEDAWNRYHLREDGQVDVQLIREQPTRNIFSNRQVEQIFAAFSTYRFFLAKDNLREVVVTR